MKRSLRVPAAALVLLLGMGGLCAAWFVSWRRAFEAEVTLRSQQALHLAGDRERVVAASLAERLETLRRTESQRPYFHYQNLYHDPKGASEGLSVTPSPLAALSMLTPSPVIANHHRRLELLRLDRRTPSATAPSPPGPRRSRLAGPLHRTASSPSPSSPSPPRAPLPCPYTEW